ncbi:homoserine kinase [Companilactobacillus sp.]|jgi:homoserine kinase|uniref:homoserine kinase n=1 Tax=Companilactobacillus sp. TaxID=2767905 RepID=UPI0025B7FA0E|nr:homoserine kinase [Companilactobacillus sp.]MCH4008585.1 homoserine kinase [Companilactobacillus sp.]MCH4051236.1 homoserine kinase [Companilactobacillus sp.]MCH4076528.1 homoserine kinase [Companilactobacillus sp.]MCH4125103.1 homoserine kinase [Companilactobacillus sp.]MCH4131644.1 homoserine kinase [Companilactobacillus sp.]
MIRIKVPATSANIGPGFDCMGLAVSLYSSVDFEKSEQKLVIQGCPEEFQNEQNLVYQAFIKCCNYLGQDVPNVKITIENNIPVARGLGSSAFCIVAGLEGANQWFKAGLSKEVLLDLATEMEGHPDNVSPAIYGKLGVSFIDEDKNVQTVHFDVDQKLQFVTLIPDYEVSTDKARAILPTQMSYREAIYQVGHAVALSKAMELGDLKLISASIIDKMHEPYRSQLIPDYDTAKKICESANGTMYISGSGSTMMAIVANEEDAKQIVTETQKDFPNWNVYHLNVDTQGAISEVI